MGKKSKKKHLICDPATCDHCDYIGEGTFVCDKDDGEIRVVIDEWEATDDYQWCRRKDK